MKILPFLSFVSGRPCTLFAANIPKPCYSDIIHSLELYPSFRILLNWTFWYSFSKTAVILNRNSHWKRHKKINSTSVLIWKANNLFQAGSGTVQMFTGWIMEISLNIQNGYQEKWCMDVHVFPFTIKGRSWNSCARVRAKSKLENCK